MGYDVKRNTGDTTVDQNGYQYWYDYENRIIRIKDDESSLVAFAYDALGRRIEKISLMALCPLWQH